MRLHLIAVGTRMPAWVRDGFEEYARRLPRECTLDLREIPLERRRGLDAGTAARREGDRVLRALPADALAIALDEDGDQWSTRDLAGHVAHWMREGTDVALLVGGPDGHSPECLRRAAQRWSLSRLTLPHGLVRVVVAEQIYRAWTLLRGHPYHRA